MAGCRVTFPGYIKSGRSVHSTGVMMIAAVRLLWRGGAKEVGGDGQKGRSHGAVQARKAPGVGRGVRRPHHPGPRRVVRRLRRGVRPALPAPRRQRHLHPPVGRKASQQLLGQLGPTRRRPRRVPHVHLLGEAGGCRADEQLDGPARDARDARRAVRWLDARPHHVRRPVLDGPARLADLEDRRAADRLGLRRGVDADHDPDGRRRARGAGRRR